MFEGEVGKLVLWAESLIVALGSGKTGEEKRGTIKGKLFPCAISGTVNCQKSREKNKCDKLSKRKAEILIQI